MYGGTAEKEETRDTYQGYVFPEIADQLADASAETDAAERATRRRPAGDLGHLAVPVGVRAQTWCSPAATASGHGARADQLLRPRRRAAGGLTMPPTCQAASGRAC